MILSACTGQNVCMAFRTACPPVCGKCGLAKAFGVRSARRLRIAFGPRGPLPKKRREDAHALQKSRDCGTKHNAQNLRKLATASWSCGELRKTLIDNASQVTAAWRLLYRG